MQLRYLTIITLVVLCMALMTLPSCDKKDTIRKPADSGLIVETTTTTTLKVEEKESNKANCSGGKIALLTSNQGSLSLPVTGMMVEESHYIIEDDYKALGKVYPKSGSQGMAEHLKRSCAKLNEMKLHKGDDCSDVYKQSWQKSWTPSENGHIGQGSVGVVFNDLVGEMFQGNMMLKKNVPRGTKLLASFNGKHVVLVFGMEIGPSSKKYIGGMTVEAHYALGSSNTSMITLSNLDDQSLKPGPIDCK